jgi:hypothetical protein
MSKIAFEGGEPQAETVVAFLMLVREYATEIGLCSPLERLLHVTMKTVHLTWTAHNRGNVSIVRTLYDGRAHMLNINELPQLACPCSGS